MSNYFNNIELEELNKSEGTSKNGVFNSLIIGAGSNAYRVDRQGLWLGSSDFSSAKFSVDMHGNLNSIGGTITGGIFQTGITGARVKIGGNDIILYDDSTGGSSPITGNTASILFTRTDEKNGDFIIQKRASKNSDDGNVLEMFFNEVASSNYNNIFMGRKGDDASTPSQWKTDVFSLGTAGIIQMSIADRSDSVSGSSLDIMTGVYFNNNIASPPTIPYSKTDAIQMYIRGAKGTAGTGDTGGIYFQMLESRGSTTGKNLMVLDYDGGVYVEKIKMYSLNGVTPSIELGGVSITSWNDVKTNLTSVGSNIVPSSNLTYDLGNSSYSWDEIYVQTLKNGTGLYATLGGISTNDITSYKNFVPAADLTYNLGNSSYAWANLYVNQIYRGTTRKIEFSSTNIVMYAPINMNGYSFLNINDLDVNGNCDIEGFVDINQYCSIHGLLYMNNQPIRDVADPTNAQDAATKAWVEANFTPL